MKSGIVRTENPNLASLLGLSIIAVACFTSSRDQGLLRNLSFIFRSSGISESSWSVDLATEIVLYLLAMGTIGILKRAQCLHLISPQRKPVLVSLSVFGHTLTGE